MSRIPSGPGVLASAKPGCRAGNVLWGAVLGLLISTLTDSSVDGLSQLQPPIRGSLPVGLPGTAVPNSAEISCGDTIEHTSIGFTEFTASGPDEAGAAPPAVVLGPL